MDETYGQWKYLYRAVDTAGQTINFLLTAKRVAAAAQRFFRKAIRHHDEPEVVTIDKSGANTAALVTLNAGKPGEETITIRQSKYLNNLIEQDHRNIKRRIKLIGLVPIFPYTFYHLIHYWFAAADIPVANDTPVHYADAIRCNVRRPLQGSLPLLTRQVSA